MGKLSIGLRGWRFEEDEVLREDGTVKPLAEIPEEPRHRLVRLEQLMGRPCDACYLIHGEADKRRCREATVVYGEPFEEVVTCDVHESDFVYWFREAGGTDLRGEEGFADAFHEWFADGGRAPDGYGGVEHVETDPDALPDPPSEAEIRRRVEERAGIDPEARQRRVASVGPDGGDEATGTEADADDETDADADAGEAGSADEDAEGAEADEAFDLDLGREYPRG
jgi:hypothetical protein